jgi:hypothetical protein
MEKKKNKLRIVLIFGAVWLLSFVGGCTAKFIYSFYNGPIWLNTIIVGIFVGLGLCFMSLTVVIANIPYVWENHSLYKKARVLLWFLLSIAFFLAGIVSLWEAMMNLYAIILPSR